MRKIEVVRLRDVTWNCKEKPSSSIKFQPIAPLSSEVIDRMLGRINENEQKSAIMTVRPKFMKTDSKKQANSDIDDETPQVLKLYLVQQFDECCKTSSLADLRIRAQNVKLCYTDDEIQLIERLTRKQNKSKFWYRLRAGRITASVFKRVCRTSISNPSISLIKLICDPQDHIFKSIATNHGIRYEDVARNEYVKRMREQHHKNFKVSPCGLILSNTYPHIGASPDGIWSCDCCGSGILEIKCPYNAKDKHISSYCKERNSPIELLNDGSMKLKVDHEYYYQVQMQLFVSSLKMAHFVVWTNVDLVIINIHADQLFWSTNYPKTIIFFKNVILPEMIGQFYTR